MRPDLSAFAKAQFGVVTAEQGVACGFPVDEIERLCESGRWTRIRHGIYWPGQAPEPEDDPRGRHLVDVAAGLLAVKAQHLAVADASAAVLWEFASIEPLLPPAVTLLRPAGKVRLYPGLRVRVAAVPAGHVVRAPNGMPACSPARTLVDLARARPLRDVFVMADDALRRGLVTHPALQQVLADLAHTSGIRAAARSLGRADGRSESVAESFARAIFGELGLPVPELQVRIAAPDGRFVARVDFYFREFNVIVEVDGLCKYSAPEDVQREKRREDELRRLGYEVVRLVWADLMGDAERVRARILAARDLGRRRAG